MILASTCVLYKFYLHNKIEIVCMIVLGVGSESSQNWVRVVSGLGPIRLGSEKYQGSELSWVRVVRLPPLPLKMVDDGRTDDGRRTDAGSWPSCKLTLGA